MKCDYRVGATGGVECIGSAHKQCVLVLLQEHLDEIVAFILLKQTERDRYLVFLTRLPAQHLTLTLSLLQTHGCSSR